MRYRRLRLPGATYFFTVVTGNREPMFSETANVDLLCDVMRLVAIDHRFEIEAQAILPDHLHALWTLPEGDADFSARWMLIKSNFSRRLNVGLRKGAQPDLRKGAQPDQRGYARASRRERRVWQKRYWEHLIRDDDDFVRHIEYIHYNPVKHGLVKAPIDRPHSTFGDYVNRGLYDAHWGADVMPPLPAWAGKE